MKYVSLLTSFHRPGDSFKVKPYQYVILPPVQVSDRIYMTFNNISCLIKSETDQTQSIIFINCMNCLAA